MTKEAAHQMESGMNTDLYIWISRGCRQLNVSNANPLSSGFTSDKWYFVGDNKYLCLLVEVNVYQFQIYLVCITFNFNFMSHAQTEK